MSISIKEAIMMLLVMFFCVIIFSIFNIKTDGYKNKWENPSEYPIFESHLGE